MKKEKRVKKLTLRLSEEDSEALDVIALALGKSKQELLEECVAEIIRKNEELVRRWRQLKGDLLNHGSG